MKEHLGLYTNPNTLKSWEQIMSNQNKGASFLTPLPKARTFEEWKTVENDNENNLGLENQNFQFSFEKTMLLCLQGDQHVFGEQWEKERLEQEVTAIGKTDNAYIVTMGDVINGMCWNPGQLEEEAQIPVQVQYARAMFEYLSKTGSLLVGIAGDHDKWMKKSGMDMYFDFPQTFSAHYAEGITYITLKVGEQEYLWGGAHKLPGSSMYNKVHAQMRAEKYGGLWGCDIISGAHYHDKKGHTTQTVDEALTGSRLVHYNGIGPYKPTDSWLRKQGFNRQTPRAEAMYGSAYLLSAKQHKVYYFDDILEGLEEIDLVNRGLLVR